MKYIPKILIYARLFIGILIFIFSYFQIENYKTIAIIFFSIGLLTDVFDGIIARHLQITTQHLRRLDSAIDQLFFAMIAIATYIQCPFFFQNNKMEIIILLSSEVLAYLICFLKFKKEIATHSIASKIWSLILFSTFIQLIATSNSEILFQICFYVGVITRFEIIGIIIVLRSWTTDVPSLYHAILLRKGKLIKRNKLFNG